MLGMVDGNGHPYSWSAIINGSYDAEAMADCGFPVDSAVSRRRTEGKPGHPGREGHARLVRRSGRHRPGRQARSASFNVVARAEDVIGQVDAVIIATDRGWEHVDRARPFIEAGLPVFIDKPLVRPRRRPAAVRRLAAGGQAVPVDQRAALRPRVRRRQAANGRRGRRAAADHDDHLQELGALRHPCPGGGLSAACRRADGCRSPTPARRTPTSFTPGTQAASTSCWPPWTTCTGRSAS